MFHTKIWVNTLLGNVNWTHLKILSKPYNDASAATMHQYRLWSAWKCHRKLSWQKSTLSKFSILLTNTLYNEESKCSFKTDSLKDSWYLMPSQLQIQVIKSPVKVWFTVHVTIFMTSDHCWCINLDKGSSHSFKNYTKTASNKTANVTAFGTKISKLFLNHQ